MITYSYQISRVICNQTLPATPDFVESMQLSIVGVDDTDDISADLTTILIFQLGETFIPFEQLSESIVINWIESHPSILTYKASIAEIIANKRNPSHIDKIPPWILPIEPSEPAVMPSISMLTNLSDQDRAIISSVVQQVLADMASGTV